MAKILQELSRKGLLQSIKGPNGRFFMDEKARKITLAQIVSAIDGDKVFVGCGVGLKVCNEKKPCPIHDEFKLIRTKLKNMLETTQIGEFTENLEKGISYLRRN